MSGGRINKGHPNYQAYIEKCKALWARYEDRIVQEEQNNPYRGGMDHPAGVAVRKLERQRNEELKKIKTEYAYLFEAEAEE